MDVDLRMLPIEHDGIEWGFSHTVLSCERRHELWDALSPLPTEPIPLSFKTFIAHNDEGTCYGDTQRTPYGEPLRCARVTHLLTVRDHEGVTDNPINRAVWAYLAELPPEWRIALYWH